MMNILSLVRNGGIKLQKMCSSGTNPAPSNRVNNWSLENLCLCGFSNLNLLRKYRICNGVMSPRILSCGIAITKVPSSFNNLWIFTKKPLGSSTCSKTCEFIMTSNENLYFSKNFGVINSAGIPFFCATDMDTGLGR